MSFLQPLPYTRHPERSEGSLDFVWAAASLLLLLFASSASAQSKAATVSPEQKYFEYQRQIKVDAGAGNAACALLTPEVFAHAAPSLSDLRLYVEDKNGRREVPYATTLSEPSAAANEAARVLNLGMRGGHIVFDLEMPDRPYTEVNLHLPGTNFLATATVQGSVALTGAPMTKLGEFTVFNFESQHLSHSTVLNLQESTFRYLHVELAFAPGSAAGGLAAPVNVAMVEGADVPPSREAQTLYTPVAHTQPSEDALHHRTVAVFHLPAHVPVERVSFAPASGFNTNFSRRVTISAKGDPPPNSEVRTNLYRATNEELAGEISRVDITRFGRPIHEAQLSVPAPMGVNLQQGATITVAIEDGDDQPLQIASVELQMRERKLCFDAPDLAPTLYYGDSLLRAPVYDFARLFVPTASLRSAALEPERTNALYVPRPDARAFTERHPDLLWVALLLVIGILAVVALRSTKHMHHPG